MVAEEYGICQLTESVDLGRQSYFFPYAGAYTHAFHRSDATFAKPLFRETRRPFLQSLRLNFEIMSLGRTAILSRFYAMQGFSSSGKIRSQDCHD